MSLEKAREQLDPIVGRGQQGVRKFLKRSLRRWERRVQATIRRYRGTSS